MNRRPDGPDHGERREDPHDDRDEYGGVTGLAQVLLLDRLVRPVLRDARRDARGDARGDRPARRGGGVSRRGPVFPGYVARGPGGRGGLIGEPDGGAGTGAVFATALGS